MKDHLNLPRPPTHLQSTLVAPPTPPPPSLPPHKTNMPMLYYGLVVVATAGIVLAIYNLIIVRWCATQFRRSRETNQDFGRRRNPTTQNNNILLTTSSSLSRGGSTISFRYKKRIEDVNKNGLDCDHIECSVCLSVFEDGEQVTRLPRCSHTFHASCIDMWLYSHSDCPLCRALVVEPAPVPPPQQPRHGHTDSALSEHSRYGLLDVASSSL